MYITVERDRKIQELFGRRAEKQEELANIDAKLKELGVVIEMAAAAEAKPEQPPARQPRQSRTTTTTTRGPGRPPSSETGGKKQPALEDVLLELLAKSKEGMSLADLVSETLKTGYESKSGNFQNMVQQAIGRLMKKKSLKRDNDSMRYFRTAA